MSSRIVGVGLRRIEKLVQSNAYLHTLLLRAAVTSGRVRTSFPFASCGEDCSIGWPLALGGTEGMSLGSRVTIRSKAFMEVQGDTSTVRLTIGDGSYVGFGVRISAYESVTIGRDVLIADRVYISDGGHNYEDVTSPILAQGSRPGKPLEIKDGSWIGIGAVILGGVTIGRGAVVGANCVVRHDVPDHHVVAGNPARVVRYYRDGQWMSGSPPDEQTG